MKSFRSLCRILCLGVLLFATGNSLAVSIDSAVIGAGGRREVKFSANPASYYILYRGPVVTNISQPVSMSLGTTGTLQLLDISPQVAAGFYRVLEVPQSAPLDTDGDGMDDVFELTYPDCLDPFNATDGSGDCDGDGRSNLTEYFQGTNPTLTDAVPKLVINEIDYDQPGTDTNEFLEVLNIGTNIVNVSHYAVAFINGNNNLEYLRVNLNGWLTNGQYLVAASTNIVAAPGARVIDLPISQIAIQNGSPDGVALINVGLTNVVNALSYAGSMTNAMINGFGGPSNLVEGTPTPVVDSNAIVGSLIRSPDGVDSGDAASDWRFTTSPTPGAANVLSP